MTTAGGDLKSGLREHWPWLLGCAIALALLWLLTPILTPFVIGAGLAYLGDPIVDRLQKLRLSRTLAVCVLFLVIAGFGLLVLVLVIPMLYAQLTALIESIPDALHWLDQALPRWGIRLPHNIHIDSSGIGKIVAGEWGKAGDLMMIVWQHLSHSGATLLTVLIDLALIPILSFYLLRDWDDIAERLRGLLPPRYRPQVLALARETDDVLGAFIRGQLSVMAALAAIYSIGLSIAGLKLALLIGVGAGLVSFVPYLGFFSGFIAASIAILVQTGETLPLLWVAIVFGIGQIAESAFLTPNLVGHRIGLHPVVVIFAVMAGGELFGFVGVLLALPAAAMLAVLLRHAHTHWLASRLYLGSE